MISIIICSANSTLLADIKENIRKTIGVAHEILAFENHGQQKGICEIYNQGVRNAKYEILCFMHEDVELHTINWGQNVIKAFAENAQLGLLGIAGSSYKSFSPSGWDSTAFRERINYSNLLQRYKYKPTATEQLLVSKNQAATQKVAVIDGVWFCSTKQILKNHEFDQQLLKKFHGYDIDISLSIGQYYDVAVTFEVFLTHFSEGNFDKDWVKETLLLQHKWRNFLPVNKAGLNDAEIKSCEKNAFKSFVTTMRRSGLSSLGCIRVLQRSGVKEKFGGMLYMRVFIKCLSE